MLAAVPHHPAAAVGAAEARLALGRELSAARALLEAVEADPDSAPAPAVRHRLDLAMARLLAVEGHAGAAQQRLATARQRRPEDAAVALTQAEVLAQLGDLDGAISAAEEAVRVAPDDPSRREPLSRLLLRRGRYAEVLAASEASPSRRLQLDRGIALALSGEPARALAELEATRRDGTMTAEAASWTALVEVALNRRSEAAALTNRLLALPAPPPAALLARARLDLARRDPASAERRLRAAMASDPQLLLARRELASLLVSQDRPDEAREVLRQALARSPWDDASRELLQRAERGLARRIGGGSP